MSGTLVIAFLRQRFTSPMRLAWLALLFLMPLVNVVMFVTMSAVQGKAVYLALVLAAGAIGQDVSSGVLQILFTRPVERRVYVTSRWFAAGLGASILGATLTLLAAGLVSLRGGEVLPLEVLGIVLENSLLAFATAAVIVLFSTLVNGLADVGIWLAGSLTLVVASSLAEWRGWKPVAAVIAQLQLTLNPELHLGWISGRGSVSWSDLACVAFTIALGLGLAIMAINRKELSYAAD